MLTLFHHLQLWGSLFGFGVTMGFLMTAIIIGAGKKRI